MQATAIPVTRCVGPDCVLRPKTSWGRWRLVLVPLAANVRGVGAVGVVKRREERAPRGPPPVRPVLRNGVPPMVVPGVALHPVAVAEQVDPV